jgi:hypothetical protein
VTFAIKSIAWPSPSLSRSSFRSFAIQRRCKPDDVESLCSCQALQSKIIPWLPRSWDPHPNSVLLGNTLHFRHSLLHFSTIHTLVAWFSNNLWDLLVFEKPFCKVNGGEYRGTVQGRFPSPTVQRLMYTQRRCGSMKPILSSIYNESDDGPNCISLDLRWRVRSSSRRYRHTNLHTVRWTFVWIQAFHRMKRSSSSIMNASTPGRSSFTDGQHAESMHVESFLHCALN